MNPDSPKDDGSALQPPAPADRPTAFEPTSRVGTPPQREDMGNGLPVGTRLGEFELTSVLGEGGFGIVYLATDHSLQRRVAIKEYMPSALAARTASSQVQVKSERYRETFEAGRRSFINEARLLAQFDHPSLVKVYRFWEANGTAYMVMPFYEGRTLRDTLRGMRSPPDEAWLRALLLPLTEALAVIHAEKCYHRDIAPDNVMMLAGSQRPLLLDFGAARRVIGDMTQALTVILKPGYAPLEQYAEIPGQKQGPWTDIYALAAVVHYAVMGKTPPPSVGRLLNDTYVPLVQAAAGRYSEPFLAAIDSALAVRPELRTQSVAALRRDLGLGEVAVDPHTTRLLPAGVDSPPQRPPDPTRAVAAEPTGVAHSSQQAAPHAAAPAPAPTAPAKGGGAIVGVAVACALLVGGYFALRPAGKDAPAGAAVRPAVPAQATAQAASAALPVAAEPMDVSRELARVVQAQSAGFDVHLKTDRTQYRIGKDKLSFSVESAREGYVYVLVYGADRELVQLHPKVNHDALKVSRGKPLTLPLPGDAEFETVPPAGPTDLLVVVSPRPRDHSDLRPRSDGEYRVFPTATAAAAPAAGPLPVLAGRVVCPATGPCVDEYGAALVRLEVVP
jgi:hypothetical protein